MFASFYLSNSSCSPFILNITRTLATGSFTKIETIFINKKKMQQNDVMLITNWLQIFGLVEKIFKQTPYAIRVVKISLGLFQTTDFAFLKLSMSLIPFANWAAKWYPFN